MRKEKMSIQDRKDMIEFFLYLILLILILHEIYLPRIGIGGIFDELLDVLVLLIFCGFCIKMLIKEKTRVKKFLPVLRSAYAYAWQCILALSLLQI